jgi:hypothetical protein
MKQQTGRIRISGHIVEEQFKNFDVEIYRLRHQLRHGGCLSLMDAMGDERRYTISSRLIEEDHEATDKWPRVHEITLVMEVLLLDKE